MSSTSPYPSIDRCVYCNSDGGSTRLTAEHIVPKFLGGKRQLYGGSCDSCAEITKKIEGHVARVIFGDLRNAKGTYTRRPRERAPTAKLHYRVGTEKKEVELPIEDHPAPVSLPHLPLPGVLDHYLPKASWGDLGYGIWIRELSTCDLPEGKITVVFEDKSDFYKFARVVAKIAHCEAVNWLGINGFEAFLPEIILGSNPMIPHFIGAIPGKHPPVPAEFFSKLSVLLLDGEFLVVHFLRLFGTLGLWRHLNGTPIYVSVVGKLDPSSVQLAKFGFVYKDQKLLFEDAKSSLFAALERTKKPEAW